MFTLDRCSPGLALVCPSQSNEDVVQDGAPGGALPLLASAQGDETPEREEGAFAQWVSL
ncbi:MAG TPA: hypothetical protein VF989_09095 [Polyangiaceae bacterium]